MVGDVMMVKYGSMVPADALVLSANQMECDERALNGEPDLKKSVADASNIDG